MVSEIKRWLKEKGYIVYKKWEINGVVSDLYLPHYRIFICKGNGDGVFEKIVGQCNPVFIRDNESEDFVKEKITNVILKIEKIRERRKIRKLKHLQDLENARYNREHPGEKKRLAYERWKERKAKAAANANLNKQEPKRKRARIIKAEKVL